MVDVEGVLDGRANSAGTVEPGDALAMRTSARFDYTGPPQQFQSPLVGAAPRPEGHGRGYR